MGWWKGPPNNSPDPRHVVATHPGFAYHEVWGRQDGRPWLAVDIRPWGVTLQKG